MIPEEPDWLKTIRSNIAYILAQRIDKVQACNIIARDITYSLHRHDGLQLDRCVQFLNSEVMNGGPGLYVGFFTDRARQDYNVMVFRDIQIYDTPIDTPIELNWEKEGF